MITWNDLKQFDVKDLDLTKIDLTRFDVRNIDVPDMPKFDMPKFDMPKFDMPEFDMPKMPDVELPADVERVAGFARDAAYAGVGAVVVTAQKLDERRRELTDEVTTQFRKLVA